MVDAHYGQTIIEMSNQATPLKVVVVPPELLKKYNRRKILASDDMRNLLNFLESQSSVAKKLADTLRGLIGLNLYKSVTSCLREFILQNPSDPLVLEIDEYLSPKSSGSSSSTSSTPFSTNLHSLFFKKKLPPPSSVEINMDNYLNENDLLL